MSPTSISGGGNLLTGGELISPASLKGQEEVLPSAKLEQWPYKIGEFVNGGQGMKLNFPTTKIRLGRVD